MAEAASPHSSTYAWTLAGTLSLVVVVTGSAIAWLASDNARLQQEKTAHAQFDFRFRESVADIEDRLLDYEQVLHGIGGLFAASNAVERAEFRRYVEALQLERRYPGVQGVGFAQVVHPAGKAEHIAAIRKQGFHDYVIRPPGERDTYTSIVYLEPFDWRNQRAFGYDMYSEPVRREAMARARDQGSAALSGKVTLVQETEADVQAGFLLYVPVYRNGAPHGTLRERRANLIGWAYAPFRVDDLMQGIMGEDFNESTVPLVDLEIYDGSAVAPANALYDSAPPLNCGADSTRTLRQSQVVVVGGHRWTVALCSLPDFDRRLANDKARMILTTGVSGSVLLALVVWLLATGRARALTIATRMTRAMRVLSNCNMALVHARSEEALLKEVCRLLVVTGGYRLAWVGYAEDDAEKSIRPVATAGLDEGYVDEIRATWSDAERGRGPTGTAVRQARVVVNQDFTTNLVMSPWRNSAQARGYRSSIALPFSGAEGVRGVLTIYSSVRGAFSRREVELLQELANDLGYGIETLRVRVKREAAEKELEFLAHHDPLTRLPNRVRLHDRFLKAAAGAQGKMQGLALLFLDMDNFKQVNDTFGHQFGDTLLVRVTERLRRCVRDGDTISRQGGDEFVILAPAIEETAAVDKLCRRIIDAFSEPFEIDSYPIHASFSIGVSFFERDGTEFQVLLKKADAALYHAKEAGRNTYLFFTEKMSVDAREEMQLRSELRNALKAGELLLHYQPQIDIRSGRVTGAEALLRWNHPERGFISPATFIPIAEKSGLIIPLGEWVLREACRQMQAWTTGGLPAMTIAVNLSPVQLRQGDVLEAVADALEDSGLQGQQLELEITESVLLHDIDATVAAIHLWKKMGVKVSIDDFGTGYSSLSYLTRLAVDKLKVDQSFVRGLGQDPDDAAVVKTIIQLGHTLGLSVIAEGVETGAQLAFLKENDCDEAQGYLYSRPLPAAEFAAFVAAAADPRRGEQRKNRSR